MTDSPAGPDAVGEAFRAMPRARFLPAPVRHRAWEDAPLPIGHGATNSQPWTVRYMLRLLEVPTGARVLDVGCGSGWTTGLLAHLTGPTGHILGLDIVAELVDMARNHLGDSTPWAEVRLVAPGSVGDPDAGPYDRILVSADPGHLPEPLVDQLAPGGRLVTPAAGQMWLVEKDAEGRVTRRATGEWFSFVPLR